jgi:hypothetical protein
MRLALIVTGMLLAIAGIISAVRGHRLVVVAGLIGAGLLVGLCGATIYA